VTEFDFQWLTENLQSIANRYCGGRLISVLEGGYNTNLGSLSPLAQSVTFHVRALIRTNQLAMDPQEEDEQQDDL
jgi:acetoin utilization deacetylase AcuC-like enzyme